MKKQIFLLGLLLIISCKESKKIDYSSVVLWKAYNDSSEVAANQEHEKSRMQFKLIQSRVSDKNESIPAAVSRSGRNVGERI